MKKLLAAVLLSVFLLPSCFGQSTLDALKADIENEVYPNIDGILVAQQNELLIEEYFNDFGRDSLHDMRSAFKSVTSLLAGIAIDQGLFKVDDEVQRFIPEWKNDPRKNIKVKDLLEMRSGLACESFFDTGPNCELEMWDTEDWLGYILDIPPRYEPGLQWEYTSMEPELVGLIIARTSGMSTMAFAKTYLFDPLGIKHYKWTITPDGRGYCAGSFLMRPLDMLKIAQLVFNQGQWEGQQIVSKKWIEASTNCHIEVRMSFLYYAGTKNAISTSAEYGYFWYRELLQYENIKTEVLFASGNGGQYLMILEDYDAAIAFTGSNYGNWRGKLPFDILLKYIIPMLENR